ncbi:uncharacterized protein LOC128615872 [Ictalurus furcatus]|uniref:uncharacterized protein LOC128615872 n=1 Tax=Ictalurus furcatus TaxID=66913 RepID=UPI0023506F7A|nr:uncharacterized protein LOC128615872 [Ictalurus furcatus]
MDVHQAGCPAVQCRWGCRPAFQCCRGRRPALPCHRGRCPTFQGRRGAAPRVPESPGAAPRIPVPPGAASSAARGGVVTFTPTGGSAPPVCCPAEAASFSVAVSVSFHGSPGPPLEGGFWRSGSCAFGGGFCYAMAGRWHCGIAWDGTRDSCFVFPPQLICLLMFLGSCAAHQWRNPKVSLAKPLFDFISLREEEEGMHGDVFQQSSTSSNWYRRTTAESFQNLVVSGILLAQWCKSSSVFSRESDDNWIKVDFGLAHESSLRIHNDAVLNPKDFSIPSNETLVYTNSHGRRSTVVLWELFKEGTTKKIHEH